MLATTLRNRFEGFITRSNYEMNEQVIARHRQWDLFGDIEAMGYNLWEQLEFNFNV